MTFWGEISYSLTTYQQSIWSTSTMGSGSGKISYANVKGIASFNDHSAIILEGAPEYSIEKWKIDGDNAQFQNKSIRGHGDADDMFNNPLDITTDSHDNIFVLDILSNGQPRIKMFDSKFVSIGGAGDSTLIPGTPVRFDWDDQYDGVHILTTNNVVVITK